MNDEPHKVHALDAIRAWPDETREPARWLIYVHQEPDEVSDSELVWERVEPWERIVATREFHERDWPSPHTASVHSIARYRVPPDRREAAEALDFPVRIDHEAGTAEAVGPDLPTNLLVVNLMHDVITGEKSPAEARRCYADLTTRIHDGPAPADMMKCRFADLETTEPAANPASDEPATATSSDPARGGVRDAMPLAPPPEPDDATALDTDDVTERTKTRRDGGDVDDAARRSSGFDLDDAAAEADRRAIRRDAD